MSKTKNFKRNLLLKIHNKFIPILEIYGFMLNNTQRFFDIINDNNKLLKSFDITLSNNNEYDQQTNLIYSKFKLYQKITIKMTKKSKFTGISQLNGSNKITKLITSYQKYSKENLSTIKKEIFKFITSIIKPKTISDKDTQKFDFQLYKFFFQKDLNYSISLLYDSLKLFIKKIDNYKKKLIPIDNELLLTNAEKIKNKDRKSVV